MYDRIINVTVLPRRVGEYLMPTEGIVVSVRMHPLAIVRQLLLILAGLVVAILLTSVHGVTTLIRDIVWILFLALGAWQGWKVLGWWFRYFVITENRMMLVEGIIDKSIGMMPLQKVTDMRLEQSVTGRVFGYAEFVVESAGQEQALSSVPFLPYPTALYQEVLRLIFPSDSPPPEQPPPPPPPEPPELAGPTGPPGPGGASPWPGPPPTGPHRRDDPGF
ncbi:MAG TPA: PH domain-containing protein [Streptosporangiaceae bacterium]|nr:PH domain-containing protein [Streptosporangiaceae bacterium]